MKRAIWTAAVLLAAGACGGGGAAPGGGGPVEPQPAEFTSLTVSPTAGSVEVGGTFQLTATPMDGAGQPMNALPAPTWSTSDAARAAVDGTGRVTGMAAGPVTVTASLTHGGVTRTATAQLTVVAPAPPPGQALASLEINPPAVTVAAGGSLALTAIPRDGAGAAIPNLPASTWSSSATGVATVSANGTVSGVTPGTATVTASLTAGGVTRTATAQVTVTTPAGTLPMSATVKGLGHAFVPAQVKIAAGGTVTWTMVDEEHDITWQGAAPPGGNIPKMDEGESATRSFPTPGTYTYRCLRHENHVEIGTVVVELPGAGGGAPPSLSLVTVTPAAPSVTVGGTVQLTATPRDQSGAAMTGVAAATWTSANTARATVSASGVVTGVSAGTAIVTATVTHEGVTRTGSVTVTVGTTTTPPSPPPPPAGATVNTPGARFDPAAVTIARGASVTWVFSGTRHNVTFTAGAPTGGNIPDTENASVSRTFPTAGTFPYTCTRHSGMNGTVTVQ